MFGTIGWIIAGLAISALGWDAQEAIANGALANTFTMVAIASAVLDCLVLLCLKHRRQTQAEKRYR